jgi:hypothetical protein
VLISPETNLLSYSISLRLYFILKLIAFISCLKTYWISSLSRGSAVIAK